MCAGLGDSAHGRVCVRASGEHMCECACARVRRGLGVTPAVGMNRVSGRALQPAAAACSHCRAPVSRRSKACTTTTEALTPRHTVPPSTSSYHYSYYLQVLQFRLSRGHDPKRSEGNVKLT